VVACGAIESYITFSTGFGLSEATRSMTQLLQLTKVVMLEEYCINNPSQLATPPSNRIPFSMC